MLNENKSKKSKVLNKTEISKIIKSKFKNNKLKDFFHDIEMFNDIQSLAKDSNIDLDLCLYGINVGIPVIKEFLSFREDMDFEKINEINKDAEIRSLFITNNKEKIQSLGINALEIIYIALDDSLKWNANFEEFINSRELKVTKWINPIEQLSICISISKLFDCYFDLDHHIKAAATILFLDDKDLNKFSIQRASYKQNRHLFLENNLTTKIGKKFIESLKDSKQYRFTKNLGYPYFKSFAKWLQSDLDEIFSKSLELYSPQNKKDFIGKYKVANSQLKLLMVIYGKKDVPQNIQIGFNQLLKYYVDKKVLVNVELKTINYDDFVKAIFNYMQIIKNVNHNDRYIKLLYKRGLFKELIKFNKDDPGPIIQKALGFIPERNHFIKEPIEFKCYEVKQVFSKQELISVGNEFSNCLRNYRNYHEELDRTGACFLIFRIKKRIKNYGSFVAYLDIRNRQCNIYEMLRKSNRNCTNDERFALQELLMNLNLIDIPDEFYAHFTMKTFTEIASKDLENGINDLVSMAPTIYALLKQLKGSNQWFYNVDKQILSEEIKKLVTESLEKQYDMKKLSA